MPVTIKKIDKNIKKIDMIKYSYNFAYENKFDWMLYLDCDEFLVLKNDDSI